ncbi:MAG: SMC-Scp complex subunit ScpB [Janthinobacterium lividum]
MIAENIDAPDEGFSLACRLVEAFVFASAAPVSEKALAELLVTQGALAGTEALPQVIEQVRSSCEGRGVTLVPVAGGWQFRTAPDLASRLTKVIERPRRLPRSAMETLAIVAYHQPCTRAEIETIRGVSLSQQTFDLLMEASLIVPVGRKEVPGRPSLWGTSIEFLSRFGLKAIGDLPRREELLTELPVLDAPETSPDS